MSNPNDRQPLLSAASDRQVALSGASDKQAEQILGTSLGVGGIEEAILQYKVVDAFTTFYAKYTLDDDDLIVLFFPTHEYCEVAELPVPVHPDERMKADPALLNRYAHAKAACVQSWPLYQQVWVEVFPMVLSEVAKEHFKADFPRIMAKYTEELRSWWFKARGYSHSIDIDRFIESFAEKLDRRLDTR